MAAFVPILYESEEVGKHMRSSKVKHSWMFEISGHSHTLDYFDSKRSHKARVCLNGQEVFKGKKQGTDFTIPLRASGVDIVVTQKRDLVDLVIGKVFFKHELDRVQRQSEEPREIDYDDYGEESVKQYRVPEPVRPRPAEPRAEVPKPRPAELPKPKPAEAPKPAELPKPRPAEAPKPVEEPPSLISMRAAPQQPVPPADLYPALSGPSKPQSNVDLLDDIFGGGAKPVSAVPASSAKMSDSLIDETIRAEKPPQNPPNPVSNPPHPVPNPPVQAPFAPAMPGMMPAMVPPGMMSGMPGMVPPNMMSGMMPQYGYPSGYPASMYPTGQMVPMSQGMGPIPAVAKDLQLSSAPNLAPDSFATNPERELPTFYTPHIGLIGPNAVIAKNDKFAEKPVILASRNPFVEKLKDSDETYTTDKDIIALVDVDNLADPFHSKPLQKKYDDQVRGVEVPGSDQHTAMRDLPSRPIPESAKNPFVSGQPYMAAMPPGYQQPMMQPAMMYPAQAYGAAPGFKGSNPFD